MPAASSSAKPTPATRRARGPRQDGAHRLRSLTVRHTVVLLFLAAGCSSTEGGALHRQVGASFQRFGASLKRTVASATPTRFALLDQRPMLRDFKNALLRLPSTLRLDTPPLPDNHTSAHMATAGSGAWQPQGILTRALSRLLP